MHREYLNHYSHQLGRHMETLVFGHTGLPVVVFPTSQGRFYEFEDRGMVGALYDHLEHGRLQLICVDSVDNESWYNRNVGPDWRIARHIQYENYILHEVVPFIRYHNHNPHLAAMGCSFGGYHAVNITLKHLPFQYLPNLNDPWKLGRMCHNKWVLATGVQDQCWNDNERLAAIMRSKGLPVQLDVWGDDAGHDWPWWQRMVQVYL
jgi:esterase/lipase superfamily enzyme